MEDTKAKIDALIVGLYQLHYRNVVAIAKRDFACASMAEDLAQEVFKEAVRSGEKLLTHENPHGWIYETLRNKMMNAKRKMLNHSQREVVEYDIESIGFEESYGMVELRQVMDQVLNRHEKMLLYMYYVRGHSARELAEMEGISEGAFKVRILRMRRRLEEAIRGKKK